MGYGRSTRQAPVHQSGEGMQVWSVDLSAPADAGQLATDGPDFAAQPATRTTLTFLDLIDAPEGETLR